MKIATKPIRYYPLHLRHVATLPWEIENSHFCRYSADMVEKVINRLHFKCTDFNAAMCMTVCWVYSCVFIKILSSSLNTMLIVDKHYCDVCYDEFLVPQIDRTVKQVKEQWHGKFYLQSVWGKTRYFKHRKYQICGCITKLEVIKMQFVWIFSHICCISEVGKAVCDL